MSAVQIVSAAEGFGKLTVIAACLVLAWLLGGKLPSPPEDDDAADRGHDEWVDRENGVQ